MIISITPEIAYLLLDKKITKNMNKKIIRKVKSESCKGCFFFLYSKSSCAISEEIEAQLGKCEEDIFVSIQRM
ncbi:MAG: hypothetical protein NTX05_05985 [Fusobacteria bacterium]|nr:hypothetical protein [Fusobacteriota bacterium]